MTKEVLDRMADYTQYLMPIPNSGFSCDGCGAPLNKGSLFSVIVRIAARSTVQSASKTVRLKRIPVKTNNS